MRAVIDLNGRQYQVEEGRFIKVDSLSKAENEVVEVGNVLLIVDGEQRLVGAPFVEGAKVRARVLTHGRDGKILVYKMRCKKGYRRKNGHRQGFTNLQIEQIEFPGRKSEVVKPQPKAERPAKAEQAATVEAKPAKTKADKPASEAKAEKPAAKKPAAKKAEGDAPKAKKAPAKKKEETASEE